MPRTLWRLPTVKSETGLTTTEIYEGQKDGTFPASVPLGVRAVAWVADEVQAWIDARIALRDAQSLEHARKERRRKGGPGRPRKERVETRV
jgi:prophage regulatory protein